MSYTFITTFLFTLLQSGKKMLAMSDHSFLKALLLELDLIIYLQCVKIFFLVKTTYHLPDEEHLLQYTTYTIYSA